MKKLKQLNISKTLENKWKTLSKRDKIILTILLIVAPLALYIKLYYLPQKNKISKVEKEIKKTTKLIENLKKRERQLAILNKEKQKIENIIKKTESYLPQKTEISGLLEKISEERERFNLEIIKFEIDKEKTQDFYNEIPIKITLKGSFINTILFLDNIRKKERILNPVGLNTKRKEENIISICTINTYRATNNKTSKNKKKQKNNRKRKKK